MTATHKPLRKLTDQHLAAETKVKPLVAPRIENSRLPVWVKGQPIQTKLTINQSGDEYEQEADHVAEQVMRMPSVSEAGRVQRCACGGVAGPDGECEACKAKRLGLQRKGDGVGGSDAPPSVHQTLNRSGQPLDAETRIFMESRFGTDFSSVRVHTDTQAARSASEVNAKAYTVGQNVVFAAGHYEPDTDSGKKLLAHELVHVGQQNLSRQRLSRATFEVGHTRVNINYGNLIDVPGDGYEKAIQTNYAAWAGIELPNSVRTSLAGVPHDAQQWVLYGLDLLVDNPTVGFDKLEAVKRLVDYAPQATYPPLGDKPPVDRWSFENEVLRIAGWYEQALTAKLKRPSGSDLFSIEKTIEPSSSNTADAVCPTPRPASENLDTATLKKQLPLLVEAYLNTQSEALKKLNPKTQAEAPIKVIADSVLAEAANCFSPYVGHGRGYDFLTKWTYSNNLTITDPLTSPNEELRLAYLENRARAEAEKHQLFQQVHFDSRCDADQTELDTIVKNLDNVANIRTMLNAVLSWQTYTKSLESSATVTLNLQYNGVENECFARWKTINSLCHEVAHVLQHPDFRAASKERQVLTEGFTEVLGDQLYSYIREKAFRDKAYRAKFEAGLTCATDLTIPKAETGYGQAGHDAKFILYLVKDDNFRAAYFLGRTELAGIQRKAIDEKSDGREEQEADLVAEQVMQMPNPSLQRQDKGVSGIDSAPRRFKDIWPEFDRTSYQGSQGNATMLAKELATAPFDVDDIQNHGIELVEWLQNHGEPEIASRVLEEVRSIWMILFITTDSQLPVMNSYLGGDPSTLIRLGKDAARAGSHDQAFKLFGVANELLSYYALKASQRNMRDVNEDNSEEQRRLNNNKDDPAKQKEIHTNMALPRLIARGTRYSELSGIYDEMREIYGFYSVLEKEALVAGDAKGAALARAKAGELQKEIKAKYTWGTTQPPGPISQDIYEPVEIAEVSYTDTRKGPGLTLHGANGAETDLTQLPGLPSPKEIGNNVQIQNLGFLQSALMAQTDFQAEIGREPEIRKAFGNEPVDLNNTKKRQKVWQIMYGIYKKAGVGALGSLMGLVGRYLKAFTVHTSYNVRDWGKSYLDSDMPTDLVGRAEKDCGVYALTVAWDVYETVKHGDSKLEVTFELTTMLDHVTLVITDKSTGEYYIVNNDYVSPPQKGDPLTQVAQQYGAIRGLPYAVGPAMTMNLGSTKKGSEKTFHDEAWTRYLAAVDWGLRTDIPPDIQKLEKTNPAAYADRVLALQSARYPTFYSDQEVFDKVAKELDLLVNTLLPIANDRAKLGTALDPIVEKAGKLAVLFEKLGPRAGVNAGSAKSRALLPTNQQYLFTMEMGHSVHPMTRVALAILHFKAQGGTLTVKEAELVKFCERIPQFKDRMDSYQAAGAPAIF